MFLGLRNGRSAAGMDWPVSFKEQVGGNCAAVTHLGKQSRTSTIFLVLCQNNSGTNLNTQCYPEGVASALSASLP